MKRIVTRPHNMRFSLFLVAVLFCMLTFNGTSAFAFIHEVWTNNEFDNAYSYAGINDLISFPNDVDGKSEKVPGNFITADGATNIKLTSATLSATISLAVSTISERGVIWSIKSGVTTADHKIVDGSISGGSFNVNVTGLDRSKTIYYVGYYIDGNGNTVLSTESSFSNVPVFSSNGNWNNASLWSVKEVPTNVAGDSVVIAATCAIDNLTINAGAKVTINTGAVLNVSGTLINNAGASGLIIKSDDSNSNGTLTFAKGSPQATVEMYSGASWDLNQAAGSKYSWQYFGIPAIMTLPHTDSIFTDCLVRKYNEAATADVDLWTSQSPDVALTSGTGYELVQEDPKIYVFKGQLTNDDFGRTLEYTTTSGCLFPGQYIFANPYTAAIDIAQIQFGANTDNSVYLYNTGTYNQWKSGDNSQTNAGLYTVSTPSTAGIGGVPSQIPSMQGFLMKTSNQSNGSVIIPYSSVISNTDLQRAPELKNTSSGKVFTRIDLSGSHHADCMWIFTDASCSSKYDNSWDGSKILGSTLTPQLYAMESDGDFQIDAVADMNGTYLGFNSGPETDYTLTFTHQNAGTYYSSLYLVDLLENKTTDITNSGTEYTFTATQTSSPAKRFKIVTTPLVSTNNASVKSSHLKVFNSNETLFIQNTCDQGGNLTIYNMNGIAVAKLTFTANNITTFSTSNLLPGAYVAKACTNQEMVTERIIIR